MFLLLYLTFLRNFFFGLYCLRFISRFNLPASDDADEEGSASDTADADEVGPAAADTADADEEGPAADSADTLEAGTAAESPLPK